MLDLGCGIGDQAAELVARGARVIGIDRNEELLEAARSRGLRNAEFRLGDLRASSRHDVVADGIWCSFVAAYVPNFGEVLRSWRELIRPGGWIVLTEVDDLFAHEPMDAETKMLLNAYQESALAADRYDFRMGRTLQSHLEAAGFRVTNNLALQDRELAFDGPADTEVLDAWAARLARMNTLREFCGARFDHVRNELLGALEHPQHSSKAVVCCCVAIASDAT